MPAKFFREAYGIQTERGTRFVQQSHHDAFAMQHGDDRNADVDFVTTDRQPNTSVLRQTFFSDVHFGHDLESADDRGSKSLNLCRHRLDLQHTVDAKTDGEVIVFRFDVNVAGFLFDCLHDQFIHQFDD